MLDDDEGDDGVAVGVGGCDIIYPPGGGGCCCCLGVVGIIMGVGVVGGLFMTGIIPGGVIVPFDDG